MVFPQEPQRGPGSSDASLIGQLRSLRERQNPHSLFVILANLFFSFTLAVDIALQRPGLDPWVHWVLLAFTLGLAAIALLIGRALPIAVGLCGVGVFTVASIYFLSPLGDPQSAVSSGQELPILALYLGWFVRRPFGRVLMLALSATFLLVIFMNPIFQSGGVLGVPSAVQMLLMALFCFEIGSMLWRRSQRRITTDQLTNVLNRAGFFERLGRDLARADRTRVPMCLAVVDFDYFKELNDTHGHHAGDEALRHTVGEWQDSLRTSDVIGRTGGDEFAILLDRIDAHGANQIMQRLRQSSAYPWTWGIAQVRPGDTDESLFSRADQQLYRSKARRGEA